MKTPKIAPAGYERAFIQFLRDDVGSLASPVWQEIQTFAVEPNKPFTVSKPGIAGAIFLSSTEDVSDYQVKPTKRPNEFSITVTCNKKTSVTFLLVGKT